MEQEEARVSVPVQSCMEEASCLASLSERFMGNFIDGIVVRIPSMILVFIIFGFNNVFYLFKEYGIIYTAAYLFIHQAVFFIINFNSLMQYGQTIGKRIIDIKIVTMNDELPPLSSSYFRRYLIPDLFSLIPLTGLLFYFIDTFFIFGKDRRCIHDLIAGTRVIKI